MYIHPVSCTMSQASQPARHDMTVKAGRSTPGWQGCLGKVRLKTLEKKAIDALTFLRLLSP